MRIQWEIVFLVDMVWIPVEIGLIGKEITALKEEY